MSVDLLKLVPQARKESAAMPAAAKAEPGTGASIIEEFHAIFSEKMKDLVDATSTSDRLDRDLAAGKTDNIHEVMIAASKAGLAVETAMQVRNMALRAYQTLTQLR